MGDAAVMGVIVLTAAALVAQLVGFARPPIRPSTTVLRIVILMVWGVAGYLAVLGLIVFNYCEAHCPSDLNLPTAGVLAAMSALDALAVWLTLRAIPRWGADEVIR